MFSEKWRQEKQTVKIDDFGTFDQYSTFKLFVEILYGICDVDSLTLAEATQVYFYSHKYQVEVVTDSIVEYLHQRINNASRPFSVNELEILLYFTQMYELDDVKKNVVHVKLDEETSMKFFHLANEYKMNPLKEKVINYLMTIEPKEEWEPEVLCAVIRNFQKEKQISKFQVIENKPTILFPYALSRKIENKSDFRNVSSSRNNK